MATKEKDLKELFLDTLKDIYYAEKQILKALPKMAKAARSQDLQAAFEKHHDETEGHVERLEQVFELLGKPARAKKCDAIEGIIEEGKEIIEEYADTPALDAGLLAAAQAVEHYEISRYGTLKAWAMKLSMSEAAKLLSDLKKRSSPGYSHASEIAVIYAALSDKNQAMAWLEKGYEERFNPGVLLRPGFDPLRSEPRFQELVGRIGLSQ